MNAYHPRTQDMHWLLHQVLKAPAVLQALPAYAEVDSELMAQVMEEAGKFVGDVIAPLNREGDETGAQWKDGSVTMPPGFRAAYQAFWQGGWPALSAATEDGGQGLPAVLEATLYEMLSAANHGWTMAPGLLHGAYECIKHHASDALKAQYLQKVATGEWLATMCLTEPHAGSDLGLCRTKAVVQADGSYCISGTKIFISGGEHDLSDNIVHLVLGRLPDAPPGPKGLSLFLVPKWYADGTRSAVHCERIEEKMGLHGSPTCVMRFDEARGWIVGEPGRGLSAMFVMMNAARLHVALQGIGLLDAAWQKADAYACERRQMRAPGRKPPSAAGSASPANAADPIAEHPAMRRILDSQRAWIDGGRLLAYRTALELDIAKHHPDAQRRSTAQRWCSLATPVLKAAFTHQAFYGGSECLQVFGGHGYVREWGVEQNVRDSRVAMIYEGTNEIQAIDLLVRKVVADGGEQFALWLDDLRRDLNPQAPADARVLLRLQKLQDQTQALCQGATRDATLAHWVADDYLRAVAVLLLDWAWAQIAREMPADTTRWSTPARALQRWVMPELDMRLQIVADAFQDALILARCMTRPRTTGRPSTIARPSTPSATPSVETVDTSYLETLVGYNARRAALAVIEIFLVRMEEFGLRPVDFSVASLIAHNPGITSRQLCSALGILPPNLVALVNGLEKSGLISRLPHPTDGRAMGLHLTAQGSAVMREAEKAAQELENEATGRLTAAERKTLMRLLQKVYL